MSEFKYFEKAVEGVETSRCYADKGSTSTENRAILKKNGIKSGIVYAVHRHKHLGHWQKVFNKLVFKVRFMVKQAFGIMNKEI
jgi:IS5 family transposase